MVTKPKAKPKTKAVATISKEIQKDDSLEPTKVGMTMRPYIDKEQMRSIVEYATVLHKSGALPKALDNQPKVALAMQFGADLGMSVSESLMSFAPIEGRMSIYGKAVPSQARKHGYRIKWDEVSDDKVTVTLTDPNNGDKHTETYTMDDAKKAGLAGKNNWSKYPKDMMRHKCLARATGFFCPQVLASIPVYEDIEGIIIEERKSNPEMKLEVVDDVEVIEAETADEPEITVEPIDDGFEQPGGEMPEMPEDFLKPDAETEPEKEPTPLENAFATNGKVLEAKATWLQLMMNLKVDDKDGKIKLAKTLMSYYKKAVLEKLTGADMDDFIAKTKTAIANPGATKAVTPEVVTPKPATDEKVLAADEKVLACGTCGTVCGQKMDPKGFEAIDRTGWCQACCDKIN